LSSRPLKSSPEPWSGRNISHDSEKDHRFGHEQRSPYGRPNIYALSIRCHACDSESFESPFKLLLVSTTASDQMNELLFSFAYRPKDG
jgi:hypothetical protein